MIVRRTFLHSGWQLACEQWLHPPATLGYSKLEWLDARVPGYVHLDLVAHGIVDHPFEKLNELGSQWIGEQSWTYKATFSFAPDPERPRRVLRFEGLDTVCTIHLNGVKIGEHDNMFVPLEIDVTNRLSAGTNELRIDFRSAVVAGNERRAEYLAREGIAPDVVRFDERAFVRKAQYMFGWDWGPRLTSPGIGGPVELIEHDGRILDVHVVQKHRTDGSVELRFSSVFEGGGRVVHFLDSGEGGDEPIADGKTVTVHEPKLWWPAGLGDPHLYRLTTLLLPSDLPASGPARDELEKLAIERREIRVGLRTLELVRKPDSFGQSFEVEVNGQPLYALGANWIPDDSFFSEIDRVRLRTQLERARDMNMNMLRVWGGGIYESEDFYDICDELGILVWQDFPYACSYYPDDDAACEGARREAAAAIRRLRHRASLFLWCGNNENCTMYEDKWGDKARHPPRYYGERIYDGVLPALLAELDPDRPYIPTSPWGGEKANGGGIGDQHYWDVWHGRGDWKYYADSTARFASEFGFAAAPGREAWARIAPRIAEPLALPVRDERARWHDKTMKGYETFIGYVELHYPKAESLEEWSYYSQLNQRDALRHGIEHYRRSEFCRGALIWQLNDCWPVQSWAVVDWTGRYKAAAFELRRLYAPALASIELTEGGAKVWAVLDNAKTGVGGPLVLEARSLADGRVVRRWETAIDLAPRARKVAIEAETVDFDPKETILVAEFQGRTTFRLLAEPKEARIRTPRLAARVENRALVVETDVPVVDLFLTDESGRSTLLDNFVTLPAPGRVALRLIGSPGRLKARSLAGAHPVEVRMA